MRDVSLFFAAVFALAALGCSAVINPDDSRLGEPVDSGTRPTLMDSGTDSGGIPGVDSGTGVCNFAPRCSGDTRLSCVDGVVQMERCPDSGAFCQAGACVERRCDPGFRECTASSVLVCNARGTAIDTIPCDNGCDPGTLECRGVSPTCAGAEPIEIGGDDEVDLCDRANERTYRGGGDCDGSSNADTGEAVYVLEIERARQVEIEVTDLDDVAIDTVVYLRTACDAANTQIACADDVPCDQSSVPGGPRCIRGQDVRQSRLRTFLEPGVYYIIADAHDYATETTRYQCGRVRIEVNAIP